MQRNAVKRAIREAFWSLEDSLSLEHDYVVVARADSAGLVEREGTDGDPHAHSPSCSARAAPMARRRRRNT